MFDAMYHSPYIASKMPVWSAEGNVRLKVKDLHCSALLCPALPCPVFNFSEPEFTVTTYLSYILFLISKGAVG